MSAARSLLSAFLLTILLNSCAATLVGVGAGGVRTDAKIEKQRTHNRDKWEKLVPGIMPWADSLKALGAMRDTFIFKEGVKLHALVVPSEQGSRRTAVVVHGYSAGPENIMMLVRMYRDSLGYNVLAPSLRHHGYSGGSHAQMGWMDRLDVLEWSRQAHDIFRDTTQVLHGVSMGAAAVMMASGEETPEYVRCFVEDCGYSSAWEEMIYACDKYLHKDSLFVARAERESVRRFGLDLHEASSTRQLDKCGKPMLFIHGDADALVPVWMVHKNYEAKARGYREMWIAPGSAHSRSFPDHPAEYTSRVRAFVSRF